MKCIFCNKSVFGNEGMTVPREGAAHLHCFQANEALKRTFQSLDISALTDKEIADLKELIIAEENFRKRDQEEDDIELF